MIARVELSDITLSAGRLSYMSHSFYVLIIAVL